jgi:hypothetical protein
MGLNVAVECSASQSREVLRDYCSYGLCTARVRLLITAKKGGNGLKVNI